MPMASPALQRAISSSAWNASKEPLNYQLEWLECLAYGRRSDEMSIQIWAEDWMHTFGEQLLRILLAD